MGHTKSMSCEVQLTSNQECAKMILERYDAVRRTQQDM
jgi:hypothetical protein